MTPDLVGKLEYAFALGCSDVEACLYANISKQTLYDYQHKHPEFVDRKADLKETPILKARKAVVEALEKNPDISLKFLERRRKDEFAPKQETHHSGNIGLKEILNEISGKTADLDD